MELDKCARDEVRHAREKGIRWSYPEVPLHEVIRQLESEGETDWDLITSYVSGYTELPWRERGTGQV